MKNTRKLSPSPKSLFLSRYGTYELRLWIARLQMAVTSKQCLNQLHKLINICDICHLNKNVVNVRPKTKNTCVSTNPTDPVFFCCFFCADPAIFIAFQKKIKTFSYLPTLKCFRKLDKKLKKCQNCKINA